MFKIKNKKLTNQNIFLLGIVYTIFTVFIWIQFINASMAYFEPLLTKPVAIVTSHKPHTAIVEVETILEDEVYMADALKQAGLNVSESFTVVWSESRGDKNAYHINTNNSVDIGIWEINSVHLDSGSITLECMTSLECSTDWSIAKRLHDGNWSAWYGARKLGIK